MCEALIPILQIRQLRFKEVEETCSRSIASKGQSWDLNQDLIEYKPVLYLLCNTASKKQEILREVGGQPKRIWIFIWLYMEHIIALWGLLKSKLKANVNYDTIK